MTDTVQTTTPESAAPRTAEPINVLDKVGLAILSLLTLTGLWMIVAPFLVGYQARGADWTAGTTNDVVVGIALTALSLAGLFIMLSGSLTAIARTARESTQQTDV